MRSLITQTTSRAYFIGILIIIGSRVIFCQINPGQGNFQRESNFTHHKYIRKCGMNDFQYGQWVQGTDLCGLRSDPIIEDGLSSDYCWQPQNCTTEKFSKEKFCSYLKGRHILIVGDSLAKDFATTLIHMMDSILTHKRDKVRVHERICSGSSKVSFLRNDHLTVRREGSPHHNEGDAENNLNWKSKLHQYDILVLHKGHHLTTLEGTDKSFKSESTETINYLKKYALPYKKMLIYFLTTSPPHPFCSNSTPILTIVNESHPAIYNLNQYQNTIYTKNYSWDKIPYYNKFHKELFHKELNATIIDVEAMSILRPDGHNYATAEEIAKNKYAGDCLHYRSTNIYQNWVKIFYNLLE